MALAALMSPGLAGAWTLPPNGGAWPAGQTGSGTASVQQSCVVASDTTPAAPMAVLNNTTIPAGGSATVQVNATTFAGGGVDFDVYAGSATASFLLQVVYPGSQARRVSVPLVVAGSTDYTATQDLPQFSNVSGTTVTMQLVNTSSSAVYVYGFSMYAAGSSNAEAELAYVQCANDYENWLQQHTDMASAIAATSGLGGGKTLANLDSDLNGLGAGSTLAQLHADLQQLHSDNQATLAALGSSSSGSSGSGTAQLVSFDSTSTSLIDGEARAIHDDMWVLIGVVVGLLVVGELLRRVFP